MAQRADADGAAPSAAARDVESPLRQRAEGSGQQDQAAGTSQLPAAGRQLHVVALVGAGPGDPDLWTQRAVSYLAHADLVLYDALVDAQALRRYTKAQCFCVGK